MVDRIPIGGGKEFPAESRKSLAPTPGHGQRGAEQRQRDQQRAPADQQTENAIAGRIGAGAIALQDGGKRGHRPITARTASSSTTRSAAPATPAAARNPATSPVAGRVPATI